MFYIQVLICIILQEKRRRIITYNKRKSKRFLIHIGVGATCKEKAYKEQLTPY